MSNEGSDKEEKDFRVFYEKTMGEPMPWHVEAIINFLDTERPSVIDLGLSGRRFGRRYSIYLNASRSEESDN